MRIETIRVTNYRSFLDSGEIEFAAGWHLIVGANNVGKSSLLDCLGGTFKAAPHRSFITLPTADEPLNPTSCAALGLSASGDEVRKLLLQSGGRHLLPWPTRFPRSNENIEKFMTSFFTAPSISFKALSSTHGANLNWGLDEYPASRFAEPLIEGGNHYMLQFAVREDRRAFRAESIVGGAPTQDAGIQIARTLAGRIYRFNAERFNFGNCQFGTRTELAPDANNLAEVLNALQGYRDRFRSYCELVREVFPSIRAVSVRPMPQGGGNVEILIWQIDPASHREDLATPLAQSGTGVGQALAILYVAHTSQASRTILIDEPGSFLHPGASRALIRILKCARHHQYIVATHSPEVLAELSDAPVALVRWKDSASNVELHAHTTGGVAADALREVGAKLSDVFGFDRILWVEGSSDADAIKRLCELRGISLRHLAVLPVRDTGAFKRRHISEVLGLYRQLAYGEALLPPAALFIFDRDGRSDTEVADALREGRGLIRFWDRRMLENYLLHPCAIVQLINQKGAAYGIETTEGAVRECIARIGGREDYFADEVAEAWTDEWMAKVDAAKLLRDLVSEISEARLQYRKTSDTPELAALVYGADPAMLTSIFETLRPSIESGVHTGSEDQPR